MYSALKDNLKKRIDHRYQAWLVKRIPSENTITLSQRKLFIFPTRQGFSFAFIILLLLIAAINYQNNLIYALTFFLGSLFHTAILYTFYNLSRLQIRGLRAEANVVGKQLTFEVELTAAQKKSHANIMLFFHSEGQPQYESLVERLEQQKQTVKVFCQARHRGLLTAPRLCIQSTFPMGLIRCWTWLDLDMQVWVYPEPLQSSIIYDSSDADSQDGRALVKQPGDEFNGLKNYHIGQSLQQAYWPSVAKGYPLQLKDFQHAAAKDHCLNFDDYFSGDVEQTLSRLCFWAQELERRGEPFSLKLPNNFVAMNSGKQHLQKVLESLAAY